MTELVRSARGDLINFKLLVIKQTLASASIPQEVEQRKQAIDIKDGVKTELIPEVDVVDVSENIQSGKAKQLKRK